MNFPVISKCGIRFDKDGRERSLCSPEVAPVMGGLPAITACVLFRLGNGADTSKYCFPIPMPRTGFESDLGSDREVEPLRKIKSHFFHHWMSQSRLNHFLNK